MNWTFNERRLKLVEGNIALLDADAIVNAANTSLILGSGVAGAIRKLGGPSIQAECNRLGNVAVGDAVITGAGNLAADFVIHTVGPVYGEGDEDEKLARATRNSLDLAKKRRLKSIAFPALSTGIFHFPVVRCSEIMLKTAMEHLKVHEYPQEILFCLHGDKALSVFEQTLKTLR